MSETKDFDWVAVSTQLDEWVALIHRDHLLSEGIESVILNKKDSAYNLNFGKGGYVYVMVQKDLKEKAEKILTDAEFSLKDDSLTVASQKDLDSELEIEEIDKPEEPKTDSDLT